MANENTYVNNQSYINKDFASIYRELLEIVPKVTNKWNPQDSNESDPGVVLIKLLALIADKLNYNVDKNILESYPVSVTQPSNARQLYDMLGYSMHWYNSATTNISMKYIGKEISEGKVTSVTVPAFTMVTTDDGSVVYTLLGTSGLSGATFSARNEVLSVEAIEGVLNQYTVGGNKVITLSNLDEDFRIYFPHSQVAENGIFICNEGNNNFEDWQKSSNLESNSLNKSVYKFGILPNTSTCYIQFPQDIANLIDDGLNIYYVTSQGSKGNVSANSINKFYSDVEISGIDNSSVNITESFVINNASSSMDGEDPETIEDAYRNYKKVVGTFDTLVTVRDYENALYQMQDTLSNAVVSDRTNDINYSTHIMTFNGVDNTNVLQVKSNSDGTPLMTAFDLGVYALHPMGSTYTQTSYNRSFTSSALTTAQLNDLVSEHKSCQHDFINTQNDQLLYILKNFFTLTGRVLTNYKVTDVEADDIEENIKLALYKNFNATKMTFGQEPDYDNIVNVIKNADSRIREVILNEPVYTLRKLVSNNSVGDFANSEPLQTDESDTDWISMISRLVMNGTVQLYRFDKRFDYDFGQNNSDILENINSITTEVPIPYKSINDVPGLEEGYLLKENENIQVFGPSLITTKSFTTYVRYEFAGFTLPFTTIPADSVYQLRGNETLKLSYKDTNNVEQNSSNNPECFYKAGDIISCNFDLSSEDIVSNKIAGTLTASQSIDIKKVNRTVLDNTNWGKYIYCYWITNSENLNSKDILFENGQSTRILDNNEYFIYTDSTKTDIVILGSGTKLVRTGGISDEISNTSAITRSQINTDGALAFSPEDWFVWPIAQYGQLEIVENQIYAFGFGTYVKLTPKASTAQIGLVDLNSSQIHYINIDEDKFRAKATSGVGKYYFTKTTISGSAKWKVNNVTISGNSPLTQWGISLSPALSDAEITDNTNFTIDLGALTNEICEVSDVQYGTNAVSLTSITNMNLSDYSWEARSRLNLNASTTTAQLLQNSQVFKVTHRADSQHLSYSIYTGWDNVSLLFSENLYMTGGNNLDVAVTDYYGQTDYTLAMYSFNSNPVMSKISKTATYYRVPSGDIEYKQGTKYNTGATINSRTDSNPYTVISSNKIVLDDVKLPEGTQFVNNFNMSGSGDHYISNTNYKIAVKNTILPFTFKANKKYLVPVYKLGSGNSFLLSGDSASVVFTPIVKSDKAFNNITFSASDELIVDVDKLKFLDKLNNTVGTSIFNYDSDTESWKLGEEVVALSDYGIDVEGTPSSTSTITVVISNELRITDEGMYYLKVIFNGDVQSCSYINIKSETDIENSDNNYLDVYRPIVLNDEFWGSQLGTTPDAAKLTLGKVEKTICGHSIYGTTQESSDVFIDKNNLFDYSFEVPDKDLIECKYLSDPAAFWDANNFFTRYTIAQLNTKDSSVIVSSSSKTTR